MAQKILLTSLLIVSSHAHAQFGFVLDFPIGKPIYSIEDNANSSSGLLAQFDAQGKTGRRFVSPMSISGNSAISNLYVDDAGSSMTYDYQSLDPTGNAAELLAQLNQQGSSGFMFMGPLASGSAYSDVHHYFLKENGTAQTFEYQLTGTGTIADFKSTLASQGLNGWQWLSSYMVDSSGFDERDLFVRHPGRAEKFSYRILDVPAGEAEYLSQCNTQGADHYRWVGPIYLSGAEYNVFVKSSSLNGIYRYTFRDSTSTRAEFLSQANALGSQGWSFKGEFYLGGSTQNVYVGFTASEGPTAPEIVVEQPKGRSLRDGRATQRFAAVVADGKHSRRLTLTIRNRGNAKLSGISVSLQSTHPGDFLLSKPKHKTLAPGASTTFKVTFRPKTAGKRSATLKIKSNDKDENPFDIRLTGEGVRPSRLLPRLLQTGH